MVFASDASGPRPRRVVHSSIDVPFSVAIVWHCFVDPDLADGWLGHLLVDPVPEGRFAIVWPTGEPHAADWFGTISVLDEPRLLRVTFAPHTSLEFALTSPVEAEASTRVALHHESFITEAEERVVRDFWRTRLDRLALLLRGHPVDWSRPAER